MSWGCSPEASERQTTRALALGTEVVVDATTQHQPIVGFGASSAWTFQNAGQVRADQLFSKESGLGLSLLRLRIAPDGTTWERATALQAQERGAAVWAAPWSPPGAWKTSGTDENGGSLLPEYYQAWADRLADFVEDCEARGIHLVALSAQNEPDWVADWETCEWTPEALAIFIGDYLAPALAERGLSTKIMGPESANWDSFPDYADAILDYPAARDATDILATHAYGGSAIRYPRAAESGKQIWETEMSWGGDPDLGITTGLMMARMMHTHLTLTEVNAWHFWWFHPEGTNAGSLYNNNQLTKKAYVLGNFARFVRPGAVRIDAAPDTAGSVNVTAYRNDADGPLVVVAVNSDTVPRPLDVRLNGEGDQVRFFQPFVTDETRNLAAESHVAVTSHAFDYELAPQSVTTFLSSASAPDPGTGGTGGTSSVPDGGGPAWGGAAGASGEGGASSGGGPSEAPGGGGKPKPGGREPEPLPETPSVACVCRSAGGSTSSGNQAAWLSVAGLLAALVHRRLRRSAA